MRLLDTTSLEIHDFAGDDIPPYATLSHTWGSTEMSYRDVKKRRFPEEPTEGYVKVRDCCRRAKDDGYSYVWIDTCSIDQRSSAELSEAINSMYKWYEKCEVCYVYLADVDTTDIDDIAFAQSRWFQRGWTLQELIAPRNVQFFGKQWQFIGTKSFADVPKQDSQMDPLPHMVEKLSEITGVSASVLNGTMPRQLCSIAERMSWASKRQTTRQEDMVYSLLGLFNINMPIIYGEGLSHAFKRLQLEIISGSPDQSIFAWRANREVSGLLAESPADFCDSATICPWHPLEHPIWLPTILPFAMTNVGLAVKLPILSAVEERGEKGTLDQITVAALNCWTSQYGEPKRPRIYLQAIHRSVPSHKFMPLYRRIRCHEFEWAGDMTELGQRKEIYILENEQASLIEYIDSFQRP